VYKITDIADCLCYVCRWQFWSLCNLPGRLCGRREIKNSTLCTWYSM